LVYGLGYGMVIVLLLVPAVLAIGHDVSRQFASLRRVLTMPESARALLAVPIVAAALIAIWFAATMGLVWVQGSLPDLLGWLAPESAVAPMRSAFMLFVGGSGAILAVAWISGAFAMAVVQRSAKP
jgi:hypothetical protein